MLMKSAMPINAAGGTPESASTIKKSNNGTLFFQKELTNDQLYYYLTVKEPVACSVM